MLVSLDKRFTAEAPGEPWETYYARQIQRHSGRRRTGNRSPGRTSRSSGKHPGHAAMSPCRTWAGGPCQPGTGGAGYRSEDLDGSGAPVRRFLMSLDIREEALSPVALPELAAIPIAFVVDRVLEVRLLDSGLGGVSLAETAVTDPHVKDYDALRGAGPARWPGRLDVSNRGLIRARQDGTSAGGAVIATSTPDLHMLGGRDEVAVLREIRVPPRDRAAGPGRGRRVRAVPRRRGPGRSPRLPAAQDRDPERQRGCPPVLPDGPHSGRQRPARLSRAARRGAAAVVEGAGINLHGIQQI